MCSMFFSFQLYDQLRMDQPGFSHKCHAIHGDVCEDELGLRPGDRTLLREKISVVFHSAAVVKFDEHLRCVPYLSQQVHCPFSTRLTAKFTPHKS